MKLKKLLAALVAGVMALTMAPIAASAAAPSAANTLSTITLGGKTATAWTTADDGTESDPYTADVILPYATANSGSILINYSSGGASVDVGTSFSSPIPGFAYDATNLITNKDSGDSNFIRFVVGGTAHYELLVTIGEADQYTATIVGGQVAGKVGINGVANMGSVKAAVGKGVTLSAVGVNKAGTATFKEWRFSPSVKIGGISVTTSTDPNAVFEMPAYSVNITAYYSNGLTYDGDSATKYKLTISGESQSSVYNQDGSYAAGTTILIMPADRTDFNKWIVQSGGVKLTYSGDYLASFIMPANDVVIYADNAAQTGTYTVTIYGGSKSPNKTYYTAGERVDIYSSIGSAFDRWYTNQSSDSTFLQRGIYASDNYFYMPSRNVVISYRDSDIDYNDDYDGEYRVSVSSSGVGTATASDTYADYGQQVRLTASPGYTSSSSSSSSNSYYYQNDPYYYLFGNGGLGYNYGYTYGGTTYTYSFTSWTVSGAYSYASGYSSTSNPTYIIVKGSVSATAYFKTTTINPVTPITPVTPVTPTKPSNANTFTSGDATATINTSTGVVTAGINATGTLNSTATANAVKSVVSRGLSDANVTVTLPSSTTAISKSAMQKLITAAGNKDLRIQIQSTYGTILLPMSSARQVMTKITGSSAAITNAIAKFRKAYGNTDIVGIQTTQNSTYGVSATYRISADAIGLGADYGDKVYVVIYNPSKGTFSRKTVTVNAKGEIAFASSASGVILFSSYPFSK
jgi:hypothetical protein